MSDSAKKCHVGSSKGCEISGGGVVVCCSRKKKEEHDDDDDDDGGGCCCYSCCCNYFWELWRLGSGGDDRGEI